MEMRREWGQFHSSPTRTPLFSELSTVLHLVLVQDGCAGSLLRHATAWDSQAQEGPHPLHQAFVDKAARPFLAVHIRGLRLPFPGFELALACLEGLFLAYS